jgi:ATP/maltotriose-dependent transcriptional regulator MalT
LPLARLRARGQLCEVRATHLQFSTEETDTFLQTVMELDLSAEAVTTLHIRTEGWIAGLQLAALSLQGRSDPLQVLADFTGSHHHIVDYLVEEVLARQPKAMQAFLLRTSILDRLTGPLCDAVTEGSHSDVLLEHLERTNLFLIPLDERRQWYRYHHCLPRCCGHECFGRWGSRDWLRCIRAPASSMSNTGCRLSPSRQRSRRAISSERHA